MAEIAHLVGLNVSLLDPSTGALIQKKSYTPQTLLNCCLVSKSWRLILLPILWRCYDDRHMGIVPRHIIVQNRSFFRYFSGQVMPLSKEEEEREKKRHMRQSRHQDMDCRSLLDLEVFFDKFVSRRALFELAPPPVFLGLIQLNPQLRHVVLASEIQYDPCLFMSTLTIVRGLWNSRSIASTWTTVRLRNLVAS